MQNAKKPLLSVKHKPKRPRLLPLPSAMHKSRLSHKLQPPPQPSVRVSYICDGYFGNYFDDCIHIQLTLIVLFDMMQN